MPGRFTNTASREPFTYVVYRAAEDDLTRIVEWAHKAFDKTANQVTRPSLLYIINQDNNAELDKWVNTTYATERVMEKLRNSNRFKEEQKLWKRRDDTIDTPEQLLLRYYMSVKVVFIPQFKPKEPACEAEAVRTQYTSLYDKINQLSSTTTELRKGSHLLFDLEMLSKNSMKVLEQLAADYKATIDLKSLAEPARSYPSNFKSHAFSVLARLQELGAKPRSPGVNADVVMVKSGVKYIATCIAGEIARTSCENALSIIA
jgi:hypothetical protein